MGVITYDDLPKIRALHKEKKIVFCSGTFDLTHAGHVLFFEDCKRLGDILVVAVGDDVTVREYKGPRRPYQNEHIRLKMVNALKPVDYALLDTPRKVGENEFFSPLSLIFDKLKPEYYAINEDGFSVSRVTQLARAFGVEPVILRRTCPREFGDISTTKLVRSILEDSIQVERRD